MRESQDEKKKNKKGKTKQKSKTRKKGSKYNDNGWFDLKKSKQNVFEQFQSLKNFKKIIYEFKKG